MAPNRNAHLQPVMAGIVNSFTKGVLSIDAEDWDEANDWDAAKERFNQWAFEHGEDEYGWKGGR